MKMAPEVSTSAILLTACRPLGVAPLRCTYPPTPQRYKKDGIREASRICYITYFGNIDQFSRKTEQYLPTSFRPNTNMKS